MKDAFAPGAPARGRITYPGYEHLTFEVHVERMEPERLFSLRWHPYAVDPKQDYSRSPRRSSSSSWRRSRRAPASR